MSPGRNVWMCGTLSLAMTVGVSGPVEAQDGVAGKPAVKMPDVVVTPMRAATESQSVPFTTYRVANEAQVLARSTPDSFAQIPSVMVQKTSYGQGSPFLRGFTGFRTLFMIDGIRLNNSTFRDGPNQYWNTVDPLSIGSYELVMGPASVLYGSDAIGGAVNALSLAPSGWDGKEGTAARAYYRGATAERSNIGRVQLGAALSPEVSMIGGFSFKDFGDLQGGQDVGRQENTGYREQDGDLRLDWRLSPDAMLTLGHQSVKQDDVWRTHKTIHGIDWEGLKVGDERVRTLDQERHLTWLKFEAARLDGLVDGVQVTLSRHAQMEDQYRVKKDYTGEYQGYDVETWGSGVQLQSGSPVGNWVYGMEYYRDGVDSYTHKFTETGAFKEPGVQGPVADDASYDSLGIYAQDTIGLLGGSLDLVPGVRYTYCHLDAGAVADPVGGGSVSMDDDWDAVCGSLRALHPLTPKREHVLFAGVSQGFRAPNLSDLTRLDTARSTEIETPVENLDPEYFTTCEAGVKTRVNALSAQVAYYYTFVDQMIVRTPTGREIDGLLEVTKKNAGEGYVQGIEMSTRYAFDSQWSAWLTAAWMDGKVDAYPTSSPDKEREYISRVMPLTGYVGLRWQREDGRFWVEAGCQAAEKADRLSADDKRDTQRIPPGGTPGHIVFDLRTGMRVAEFTEVTLGLENVADEDYRIHGSGVNEPGRNFIIAVNSQI